MIDLRNGEILALVSSPSFDPNIFVTAGEDQKRVQLLKNASRPLVGRTTGGLYPPGSVFKLVTAIAGLETGKITPQTAFHCKGYFRLTPSSRRFKCWESMGHGSVDLFTAIERSCNVYFYNVGRLVGEKELYHYAHLLGFGEPIGLEIPAARGLIPSASWKKEHLHAHWYEGETISFAIGQGYVQVTPLQIAQLVAVIATDGRIVKPTLIKRSSNMEPVFKQFTIGRKSLQVLRQGMLQVVESKYGTGQLARVDFLRLAAKTGTAQNPPKKAHAWFTGFFPYEDPEIALVVFVEHGGSGGLVAAKAAKRVLSIWHKFYGDSRRFEKPLLPPVTLAGYE